MAKDTEYSHTVQALQASERSYLRANKLQATRIILLQDATRGKCSKQSACASCESTKAQNRTEKEMLELSDQYSEKLAVQQKDQTQRATGSFSSWTPAENALCP